MIRRRRESAAVENHALSGVAVRGQRVAPGDQEANLTRGAALDELDEVVGQEAHHHTPS